MLIEHPAQNAGCFFVIMPKKFRLLREVCHFTAIIRTIIFYVIQCRCQKVFKREVIALKNFMMKYSGILAAFALFVTTATANSTCICVIHQEKLPECAKKLRKF